MKNMEELQKEISGVFDKVKSGDLTQGQAKEMNRAVGHMINSVKTEIHYQVARSEVPKVKFMR